MTQMADGSLEAFVTYPSIGAIAGVQTTGGPGELAAIEMILVAMTEAGLDREDSVRFYGVLSSYVISFASAQAGAFLAGNLDTNPAWIGVTRSLDQTRHPTLTDVRDELAALRDRDIYRSGVQVILDAVAARAALAHP
jgi:hypothetical protein